MTLDLQDDPKVELVRSKRRTIALEVRSDAKVIVRAPMRLPVERIHHFLDEHRAWILKKRKQIKAKLALRPALKFRAGESFLFLGKEYPLRLDGAQKEDILLTGSEFVVTADAAHKIKQHMVEWYRFRAERYFETHVRQRADEMQVRFKSLKLSRAKGSWGVCMCNGNLRLNWRLILAPPAVVDYVIVHELSHMVHHNHSAQFWSLVAKFCPDYKKYKVWLTKHTYELLEYS